MSRTLLEGNNGAAQTIYFFNLRRYCTVVRLVGEIVCRLLAEINDLLLSLFIVGNPLFDFAKAISETPFKVIHHLSQFKIKLLFELLQLA
jgi:hypothetical protein